jgi:hypothetical protein
MKFDMNQLSPWADLNTMFGNMKSMEFRVGNDTYSEAMDVTSVDGHLVIELEETDHVKKSKKKPVKGAKKRAAK